MTGESNITILVNGSECLVPDACSIGDLLSQKQLNPAHVVIEVNNTILSKDAYAVTRILPDDHIEILRFVGGG